MDKTLQKIIGIVAIILILVLGTSVIEFSKAMSLTPTGMDSNGYFHIANPGDSIAESYVTNLSADLASKQPLLTTGSIYQYVRGDLSLATFPTFATVATTGSYTDLVNKPTIPTINARVFNNTPTHPIQTIATAANGFQLSSSRDVEVSYSVTISTTVSLSGNATGYVVLEIAPTNSTTASDWVEVSRVSSGQTGTLVVGLVLNQTGGGALHAIIPAGYYARLRSVNTSGTPTYVYNSGQEVQL